MRIRHIIFLITAAIVFTTVFIGCGGSDEAAERTAEKLVEESAGGDVDVDIDGDNVKVEGKDGSFSTSSELPDGWPEEIKMPDGTKLAGSSAVDSGNGMQLTASGTVKDMDIKEVTKHFEGEFDGWTKKDTADLGSGDDAMSNRSWTKGDQLASVVVTHNNGETSFVATIGSDPTK